MTVKKAIKAKKGKSYQKKKILKPVAESKSKKKMKITMKKKENCSEKNSQCNMYVVLPNSGH